MNVTIYVAGAGHIEYAGAICKLMYVSALERGTGIAERSADYIAGKMAAGKAVIALDGDRLAGFAYIETWGHDRFVANSGLIVAHEYREQGLAKRIKKRVFDLSRKLYPDAKIFSITTGLAVMKLNTQLGFKPVPFSELTDDPEFWKGCIGCRNYDILVRNDFRMCLCTGLLYDPKAVARPQQKLLTAGKAFISPVMRLNSKFTIKNKKHGI